MNNRYDTAFNTRIQLKTLDYQEMSSKHTDGVILRQTTFQWNKSMNRPIMVRLAIADLVNSIFINVLATMAAGAI